MAARRRLDSELVRRGLARSRGHASELIAAGRVLVAGGVATKPATHVDPAVAIHIPELSDDPSYASRGGFKLAGALEAFAVQGLQVADRQCLDVGASTGGFTDVLLRWGAAHVVALDVGYAQLAWSLRSDARVTVIDRTNARDLTPHLLPYAPQLVVADVSFISLTMVLGSITQVADPQADLVLMVKPQFEVGRTALGAGGVVRDRQTRAAAVATVVRSAADLGWGLTGVVASPLPGPKGNVEYFIWLRADAPAVSGEHQQEAIAAAVAAGPA